MRQFAMLLSVIAPVSLSLEYDYLGFRSAQVPFTSAIVPGQVFPINISQKIHTVLFGINYHFVGGGGAPVRAQWA